ncbi:MAG: DUF883 family protein [Chthoniobacterales bacterium]|nr:DUF883 family protein [Chthoniobacterales bacterium]
MAEENQGNQGGGAGNADPASADAPSAIDNTKQHARQAAEGLRTAATQMAGEYRGKAEQAWEDASVRVRTFQEDGEQYVRENPARAVFSALGIGFVLGIIFRR